MDKPYLLPEELAERWQVSTRLVRKLLHEKQLTGYKIGGMWRIRPQDVYEYEKRQRNTTSARHV